MTRDEGNRAHRHPDAVACLEGLTESEAAVHPPLVRRHGEGLTRHWPGGRRGAQPRHRAGRAADGGPPPGRVARSAAWGGPGGVRSAAAAAGGGPGQSGAPDLDAVERALRDASAAASRPPPRPSAPAPATSRPGRRRPGPRAPAPSSARRSCPSSHVSSCARPPGSPGRRPRPPGPRPRAGAPAGTPRTLPRRPASRGRRRRRRRRPALRGQAPHRRRQALAAGSRHQHRPGRRREARDGLSTGNRLQPVHSHLPWSLPVR